MVRRAICLVLITIVGQSSVHAVEPAGAWHFSSEEIEAAYRYQERYGQRLQRPVIPDGCFHGREEVPALFRGAELAVPCRFLTQTIRHLKQMLETGAARYLFPLDADHGHLGVPAQRWRERYASLPPEQILPEALRDPKLIVVYHTAEHLGSGVRKNAGEIESVKEWRAKRNVLGFFDGRPLAILPPLPDGAGRNLPAEHVNIGTITFLVHRLGAIVLSANGKAVSLDLSFDDEVPLDLAKFAGEGG